MDILNEEGGRLVRRADGTSALHEDHPRFDLTIDGHMAAYIRLHKGGFP
ncbi:MAG TPA: hypothetical protein VNA69_08200 [Thermoanaerobaculia bacterium]|nr:hypothetical protein [Thermoanaerobaculia bacterium]